MPRDSKTRSPVDAFLSERARFLLPVHLMNLTGAFVTSVLLTPGINYRTGDRKGSIESELFARGNRN